MKRFCFLVLFIAFTSSLHAQGKVNSGSNDGSNKFDSQVKDKVKNGKDSDILRVIIQSHDLGSLPGKLSNGKNGKGFRYFPGISVQLPLGIIKQLAKDPTVDVISVDADLSGNNAADGTEPPNSSSGALAALNQFGSAGAGVGVAVIDSGIASSADLPNVVYRMDFTGMPAGDSTDPFGHGSHVAGIVGGSGTSSNGLYAGVAPGARLIDLRVLDGNGGGSTSNVIAAIDWAIANRNAVGSDGKPLNIRVLNISLGHLPYEGAATDPLAVECRKAEQSGLVVVAAAGNFGKDANGVPVYGTIITPGIEESVITVGAVTTWGTPNRSDDVVASYSSKGPTIDGISKPDLTAPGSRIVSVASPDNTLLTEYPFIQTAPGYMMLSGSSMAAPEVSGAVAMMLSVAPSLTPNMVKAILMYTSEYRGSPLSWGAGYLNVLGAMELTSTVNPSASVNANWLKPSKSLPTYDVINGYPVTWGQSIVWRDSRYKGNSLFYNKGAWAQTIVWGETIVWDETIVWGETIVWDTSVPLELTAVSAQTIVWDDVSAMTVVWGESVQSGDGDQ